MTFPAQFMLVAAMNPSPGSGGFGDAERGRASAAAIRKYLDCRQRMRVVRGELREDRIARRQQP